MKYSRFEWLTIGIGAAAVVGTIAFSVEPRPDWVEIAAQLMLLAVLVVAVHWGRRGGLLAGLTATLVYVLLRIPVMIAEVTLPALEIIVVRAVTYGVIGIAGGEACSRIKYFFASLEDGSSVDEASRVYNQRFVARLLRTNVAEMRRYGTDFCVALITLSPLLTSELRPSKVRRLVRAVADHIRNDVRLIDDVGRLDDGRFVLILPHTPKAGGHVAADRVRKGVRDVLGSKDESVTASVLDSEQALDEIERLLDSLETEAAPGGEHREERRGEARSQTGSSS